MDAIPPPGVSLTQAAGGAAAPWWGVPVIAGGFLVLGAVLGFIFNRLNEDRKSKHAEAIRWDDLIRTMSVEALVTVRDIDGIAMRFIPFQNSGINVDPALYAAAEVELDSKVELLHRLTTELSLIAPDKIAEPLGRVWGAATILRSALLPDTLPNTTLRDASLQLSRNAGLFSSELRIYFGVTEVRWQDNPVLDIGLRAVARHDEWHL